MSLSLTGAIGLLSAGYALLKKAGGLMGSKVRAERIKKQDEEIDKKGDVDEAELRKRLKG